MAEELTLLRKYADFCFYLSDALSTHRIDEADLDQRKAEWLTVRPPDAPRLSENAALVARALADYANSLMNRLYHELGRD